MEAAAKTGSGFSVFPRWNPLSSTVFSQAPRPKAAGLQKTDIVTHIDGEKILSGHGEFMQKIKSGQSETVELTVVRNGSSTPMKITVQPSGKGENRKIGVQVTAPYRITKLNPVAASVESVRTCARYTKLTFEVRGKLLRGRLSIRSISGPVDIARISGEAARNGIITFFFIMGVISLQLGIFNLLPIPMLDGGHIFLLLIESVIRRDINTKLKEKIAAVGFFILISLMVVVIVSDILKNISR
ncbi:MAG: RIP metalloprotease RseP [Marinilabiliales bacterium]|nr:RIP metalloprotease RseP [Marinilabiliales bacterium]